MCGYIEFEDVFVAAERKAQFFVSELTDDGENCG